MKVVDSASETSMSYRHVKPGQCFRWRKLDMLRLDSVGDELHAVSLDTGVCMNLSGSENEDVTIYPDAVVVLDGKIGS